MSKRNFGEWGPASDQVMPIQIREDTRVLVAGLPHDLTRAEAEKIARVIQAHAKQEIEP